MTAGFLFDHDEQVAEWVASGIDGLDGFVEPFVAFGYVSGEKLVSGAVFNEWNGSNIEVSIRSARLGREFIRGMYDYAFVQMEATRVTLKVRRSNKLVLRLAPKFGFTYEATLKRFFGPEKADDAVVFRLLSGESFKAMRQV